MLITISSVQMRTTGTLQGNTDKICSYISDLAANGSQVILFPECALTGYDDIDFRSMDPTPVIYAQQQVADTCKQAGVWAIVGTPDWRRDKLFNSALIINDKGTIIERYNKIFLAESWPDPGDHIATFDIAGTTGGMIICHDVRYPELVRLPAIKGARIIFYSSHESGMKHQSKIGPYRAQVQARAVENNVWLIQSNAPANPDHSGSHGQSRIVQPDGNIVAEASIYDEEVVTATIDPDKASRKWAMRSLDPDFLKVFWSEGIKIVQER